MIAPGRRSSPLICAVSRLRAGSGVPNLKLILLVPDRGAAGPVGSDPTGDDQVLLARLGELGATGAGRRSTAVHIEG